MNKYFKHNKYIHRFFSIGIICVLVAMCSLNLVLISPVNSIPLFVSEDEEDVESSIEEIYNKRSEVLMSGDLKELPQYFDLSQKYGKWALEHEVMRTKYLNHWVYQRNILFTDIKSSIIMGKVKKTTNGVRVSLKEICKFDYVYKDEENPVFNSFSVGIRHTVSLVKKEDKWVISNDWYTDCFEDALKKYTGTIEEIKFDEDEKFELPKNSPTIDYASAIKYNRKQAVEYADKYCGASPEKVNNFKYNKKYRDYTGIGGDCTNFASQVLGDKEAGSLRQDGTWRSSKPKFSQAEGSRAWVNADAFKNYLMYSGKGRVIKRGSFKELALSSDKYPMGAVEKLQLGDLVCYAKGSNVDHFAIVTGWDSHGYPLINSHTTDRYHVPWDLGWGDKKIIFYLIKIR